MASSTKVAVMAALMLAMLLAASTVEAARPIVAEGEAVAADGSLMTRNTHGRQLRTFWWFGYHGCGFWNWWYCHPYVPAPAPEYYPHSRKLKWGFRLNYRKVWHGKRFKLNYNFLRQL